MTSNYPLVSVVIPNYNHRSYLEQRIESVLKQTYANFELILLDDYSSDKSLEFINKYEKNPKIKAIIGNDKNSGSVFKQWVKGISLSSGKYLWIAESDDYADESFLEETVKLAENNPGSGLVFTDSINIDKDDLKQGKISERHKLLQDIYTEYKCFKGQKSIPDYFIEDMLILNASAVLFNIEKFKETVDLAKLKTFQNTGDQFIYISILCKYEIIYLNKALNYRRVHDENTTKINFANGVIYKERIRILNNFLPLIKNFSSSTNAIHCYLQQNFIKAIDFGMYDEMVELLGKFRKNGFLRYKKYRSLKLYIFIARKLKGSTPYKFRIRIKKILQNQ